MGSPCLMRRVVQFRIVMFTSYDTLREKIESFWPKGWVTGGTNIRLGKVGNWRIFESNWLNIESRIDSTLRVELTHIESQINSTLRIKSAIHWESIWLKIENHVDSKIIIQVDLKMRVKLTQQCWSIWLNIKSQLDSTLRVKLTQIFYSYLFWQGRILVPPVTQFFRSKTQFFLSVYSTHVYNIQLIN